MRISPPAVIMACAALLLTAPSGQGAMLLGIEIPDSVGIPSSHEVSLDRLLSIYEDLGAALANVENVTDADMVAARVAVDLLLLRGMDKALTDSASNTGTRVSPEFVHLFKTRREQAGLAVENAARRLREADCFGSAALPAALSFIRLLGGQPLSPTEAQTAVQELLANNREMILILLDKAVDADSADVVASLVESACRYEAALTAYNQELGDCALDATQTEFFNKRVSRTNSALQLHKSQLEEADYFGSSPLRDSVEGLPLP